MDRANGFAQRAGQSQKIQSQDRLQSPEDELSGMNTVLFAVDAQSQMLYSNN